MAAVQFILDSTIMFGTQVGFAVYNYRSKLKLCAC